MAIGDYIGVIEGILGVETVAHMFTYHFLEGGRCPEP